MDDVEQIEESGHQLQEELIEPQTQQGEQEQNQYSQNNSPRQSHKSSLHSRPEEPQEIQNQSLKQETEHYNDQDNFFPSNYQSATTLNKANVGSLDLIRSKLNIPKARKQNKNLQENLVKLQNRLRLLQGQEYKNLQKVKQVNEQANMFKHIQKCKEQKDFLKQQYYQQMYNINQERRQENMIKKQRHYEMLYEVKSTQGSKKRFIQEKAREEKDIQTIHLQQTRKEIIEQKQQIHQWVQNEHLKQQQKKQSILGFQIERARDLYEQRLDDQLQLQFQQRKMIEIMEKHEAMQMEKLKASQQQFEIAKQQFRNLKTSYSQKRVRNLI